MKSVTSNMDGMEQDRYTIAANSNDPEASVVVTDSAGREWLIHREDADPEHRFTAYRLAAGWFGNLPAGYETG